jgi:inositol phosphorylceramide synthase catalytic subunit
MATLRNLSLRSWLDHVRGMWGPWWLLPGGLPILYLIVVAAIGDFRPEHAAAPVVCCVFAYTTKRLKSFYVALLPFLLTAFGYDAIRYPRAAWVTAPRVTGCALRALEVKWFGVGPDTSLPDFFQVHHHPVADVLCAGPYFAFAYIVIAYGVYLYFRDRPRMSRFLWSFTIANLIAFAFWLILPAAPPWYIRAHGCVIDATAAPSSAGLARVDALLGITYFARFYSRAVSVFGAFPSMHCAFPFIGLLTAWRHIGWKTRPIHIAYVLWMALSAVYLDHHWVIDVLGGWAVAASAVLLADLAIRRWNHRRAKMTLAAPQVGGVS